MTCAKKDVAKKLASAIPRKDLAEIQEIISSSSLDSSELTEALVSIKMESSEKNVLHIAASGGTVGILTYLMELVLNIQDAINETDTYGFTVLHRAAYEGGISNVTYLCGLDGIDVNRRSTGGWTPLDRAAFFGKQDCVEYLITKCPNVEIDCQDNRGCTPLHTAVEKQMWEIVDYLCKKGCNCDIENENGKVPLQIAINKGNFSRIWPLVVKTTNFDFDHQFSEGNTLLHKAITSNSREAFDYLTQKDNVKNIKNNDGLTPFDLVVKTENFPLSKLLQLYSLPGDVESHDVNRLYRGKKTLLHIALEEKDKEALEGLCTMNGIQNIKDDEGCTPFDRAADLIHDENQLDYLAHLYKLPGAGVTDINQRFRGGKTLMHIAVQDDNLEQVRRILNEYKDGINLNVKDDQGITVLHHAVQNDKQKLVRELLKHNSIDVNSSARPNNAIDQDDYDGTIPLAIALEQKHHEIMIYLFSHPTINVDFKDKTNNGVLQILRNLMMDLENKGKFQSIDNGHTILSDYLNEENIVDKDFPNALKNLLEPKKYVVTLLEFLIHDTSTPPLLREISAALKNIIIIGLQNYAAHASLQYVFYKPEIYVTVIKIFLDRTVEENKNLEDTAKILRLVFLSLQSNITCEMNEREFLEQLKETSCENSGGQVETAKLNKEQYENFKDKIRDIVSRTEDEQLNEVELIATRIWKTYFEEEKEGALSCVKNISNTVAERLAKRLDKLFHKCIVRGNFTVISCLFGIVIYISDIVSDVLVGLDTLSGSYPELGIAILALTFITLVHENVRSSYELYETEKQSLRTKLGRYKLEDKDWEDSDLNYTRCCFFKWFLPFRYQEGSKSQVKFKVKSVVFNILSFFMMRPAVDRLIVLVHSKGANLRNVYRQQSKQRALNQYFMILEQIPELFIQFYLFQIFFAFIDNEIEEPECAAAANGNIFTYKPKDFDCAPNWIFGYYVCVTWMRVYSMAVPFFMIPLSMVRLETSFRVLDPHTLKISEVSYFMLYIAYVMMIPSRLFLFAGVLLALENYAHLRLGVLIYIAATIFFWLVINGASLKNSKKKAKKSLAASKNLEQSNSFWRKILKGIITCWTLFLFSFRDIVVISLRDPTAYIDKPYEASYGSLRCWTKIMTISGIYFVEGLVGAVIMEEYYPCGKSSHIFKYQGWALLLLCILSSGILATVSYSIQPPLRNVIKKHFKSTVSSVTRYIIAMCFFSGFIFTLESFTTKILIICVCTIVLVIYRSAAKCIRVIGEAKKETKNGRGGNHYDASANSEETSSKGQTVCSCFPSCSAERGDYTQIEMVPSEANRNGNQDLATTGQASL